MTKLITIPQIKKEKGKETVKGKEKK